MLLQMLAARHWPEGLALIGAAIVAAFYASVSGRSYCAWVCPINPVTDLAFWTREKLGLQAKGWQPRPGTRWLVLAMILVVSAVTGAIAWELVNPITMAFRAVVFGSTSALTFVAAVFLFDLFVARGLLRAARLGRPGQGLGHRPLRLRSLHGLLRGLSGAAGHLSGPRGRQARPHPGDPVTRLHHLRPLHRRVRSQRLPLHPSFQWHRDRGGGLPPNCSGETP